MKQFKIIIWWILLLLISSLSCSKSNERKMYVWLKYDNGINYSETKVYCDSLQMITKTEAFIFIDGVKQRIVADVVRPSSNYWNN